MRLLGTIHLRLLDSAKVIFVVERLCEVAQRFSFDGKILGEFLE